MSTNYRYTLHRTVRTARLLQGQNVTITETPNGGFLDVVISASGGGGGGGGAPTDAKYLTLGTNATLTEERVLAPSARFAVTDGGAGGNYVLDFASAGTAGTYAYPVSLTTDAYGRVTGVTAGQAPATPPSPASSVVTETSYGQSSATGTSSNYARADHTHGTVALPAHSSLSELEWINANHTGADNSVATWDANGSPQVVQATDDETMLVRRAGVLQWVPLVSALSIISGEFVLEGGFIANDPVTLYTGTFV
jgi:hypothetical protein